jgi:hypothetical protein
VKPQSSPTPTTTGLAPACAPQKPTWTPPKQPTGPSRPGCYWARSTRPTGPGHSDQADHPRIAAFNTATTLARAVRVHTSYARANREAHALIRQALTGSGDIDPHGGVLTVRLDPLPTRRATTAIAELCEHLTATETRYTGTDLILRFEIKTRP